MKYKAGIVLSSYSWGGLELNLFKLATWLASRGWDITLYIVEGSKIQHEAVNFPGKISLIPCPRKYFSLAKAYSLSRTLKANNIQNILISNPRDIDFLFWVKLFMGFKLRVMYLQQMQIGISKKDLLHTMRFSAINIWMSPLECLKKEVIERTRVSAQKISVVPLGIDTSSFINHKYTRTEAREKLNLPQTDILMGIMGRIDPQKGQLFLVKAVDQLQRKNINAGLLIIGEPTLNDKESSDYFDEMQQFIKNNNLSEKIHYRGFTNDVSVFYNSIDIFTLASKSETYGMVTVEAMLSGLPVIGTNRGGTPEILNFGELGALYEPNDLSDFCSKVEWIITHPDAAQTMAQKASQSAASRFSNLLECKLIEEVMM
jgi:glycosyltransferase involved in cell wall biosynthesis